MQTRHSLYLSLSRSKICSLSVPSVASYTVKRWAISPLAACPGALLARACPATRARTPYRLSTSEYSKAHFPLFISFYLTHSPSRSLSALPRACKPANIRIQVEPSLLWVFHAFATCLTARLVAKFCAFLRSPSIGVCSSRLDAR